MKFFKSLSETLANKPKYDDFLGWSSSSMRFIFEDKTNPKYPYIDIWNNGEVCIYDTEDRVCIATDELILKYCNMKDDELVLVSNSKSVA